MLLNSKKNSSLQENEKKLNKKELEVKRDDIIKRKKELEQTLLKAVENIINKKSAERII